MISSRLRPEEQAEVWRRYRTGESMWSISRTLGRSLKAVRRHISARGGRAQPWPAPLLCQSGRSGGAPAGAAAGDPEADPLSRAPPARQGQAGSPLVAAADCALVARRPSGGTGVALVSRDDLPLALRAAAGHATQAARPVSADPAQGGPAEGAGRAGPRPSPRSGGHQRAPGRGGRSGGAGPLGRRPPARAPQQRHRHARRAHDPLRSWCRPSTC